MRIPPLEAGMKHDDLESAATLPFTFVLNKQWRYPLRSLCLLRGLLCVMCCQESSAQVRRFCFPLCKAETNRGGVGLIGLVSRKYFYPLLRQGYLKSGEC